MGWLIASIICGIEVITGIVMTLSASKESIEGATSGLIVTLIFAYLSYYFMKRYKKSKGKKNAKIKTADIENDLIENEKIEQLNEGLPVIEEHNLFIGNEILHYMEPATLIESKRKVVGHTGRTAGLSVRLMKGVTVRTGGYGGNPIYDDVSTTFEGKLAATNKRIIFVNQKKGFEVKLSNISLIEPYEDGVIIQVKTKSYPLLLDEPRYFMELMKMITTMAPTK